MRSLLHICAPQNQELNYRYIHIRKSTTEVKESKASSLLVHSSRPEPKQSKAKMAAISLTLAANPNRINNSMILSYRTNPFCSSSSSFAPCRTFLENSSFSISPNKARVNRPVAARISNFNRTSSSSSYTYDVVVVGAGIIGLSIANKFLLETDLSVAVVDAAIPCSGATGAGSTSTSF